MSDLVSTCAVEGLGMSKPESKIFHYILKKSIVMANEYSSSEPLRKATPAFYF